MSSMFFRRHAPVYEARAARPSDAESVQRLIERAWRVHLRIPPEQVPLRLKPGMGWVAGEGNAVSGVMLAEIQPFLIALITAAVLSDDWRVSDYLNTFLPSVEETTRREGATALVQIGYAPWLTAVLYKHGFVSRDWVVTYEWHYQPVTVSGNQSVTIRLAHLRDLPTLLMLDKQIFGPIWHKPISSFEEALARAFIFSVAEQDGEIVGYQWCENYERHGHITRLAVRADWEGQGVGTRLLTEALVSMVKAGVNWVTLNTQESNLRSQILYERHSFRPTGDRVAVLWKDLGSVQK
jgi:ribosomal-protein-alanine N-acetyltransferase